MRHRILALLALVVVATPAFAETRVTPATFVFAKPGTTTRDQAVKLAGTPTEEYESEVLQGETEIDVVRTNPARHIDLTVRSEKSGRRIERVKVAHWRDDVDTSLFATLVFRDGKLAWAIVPVSESESTKQKLLDRYGDIPKTSSEPRVKGDLRIERTTYAFPARGVTCVQRGDEKITHKVIYAPLE